MTNVSPVPSPATPNPVRPTGRATGVPSQLAPTPGTRPDDVRLSDRALESRPAASEPIRAELVSRVRTDIEAGLYSDEAIDDKIDAILPKIIEDLKKL